MRAERISVEEAKPDKLFYLVANAVIYRAEDRKCLLLKRDEREKVHPGKWATVGGKLEHENLDLANPSRIDGGVMEFDDAIPELLIREALEESGVTIEPEHHYIGSKVIVRPDGIPVVLIKFATRYARGEVKPEAGGFSNFAWVNADEVDKYDCIEGVADEVKTTIKLLESVEE